MGVRKGELREALPLDSEHRLRRAQDKSIKQLPLYSAAIAGQGKLVANFIAGKSETTQLPILIME